MRFFGTENTRGDVASVTAERQRLGLPDPLAGQRCTPHSENLNLRDPVAQPDDFNNKISPSLRQLGALEANAPLSQPAGALNPTDASTARLVDYCRAETIQGNKDMWD